MSQNDPVGLWELTRGTGKFQGNPALVVTQNGNLYDFTWGDNVFRLRGLPYFEGTGHEQCLGERKVGVNWVAAGLYAVTYTCEMKEGSTTLSVMDGASELILPPSLDAHPGHVDDPLSGTWGAEGPGMPMPDAGEGSQRTV